MKLFNSFVQKSGDNTIKDISIIKVGFSIPAFFFGILWFIHQRMWKESVILILINWIFAILYKSNLLDPVDFLVLEAGFCFLVAANANYWHGQHLEKAGYNFSGCVFGENKDDAKLKFINNYLKVNDSEIEIFAPSADKSRPEKVAEEQYFVA